MLMLRTFAWGKENLLGEKIMFVYLFYSQLEVKIHKQLCHTITILYSQYSPQLQHFFSQQEQQCFPRLHVLEG